MWSDEEARDARQKGDAANRSDGACFLSLEAIRAIMTRAVELAAARAGTVTAEETARLRADLEQGEYWGMKRQAALLDSHTTQGATVVTLQAKVAELENERTALLEQHRREIETVARSRDALQAKVGELDRMWRAEKTTADRYEEERDTFRAEVERLKTENAQASAACTNLSERGDYWKQRAMTAESRFAAIRERVENKVEAGHRLRMAIVYTEPTRAWSAAKYEDRAAEFGRWLLEGDAPNPSTTSNGSSTMAPDQQHADLQRLTGADPEKAKKIRAPHAFVAGPDGSSDFCHFSDGDRMCGWERSAHQWPCSPTCTHDDAAQEGHPERVKERSEAVAADLNRAAERSSDWWTGYSEGHDVGADKMRAACLEAVTNYMRAGFGGMPPALKAAVEGAAP